MGRRNKNGETESPNQFRFNLAGLIIFSVCLIAAAFFAGKFFGKPPQPYSFAQNVFPDLDPKDKSIYTHQGAWGEVLVRNIQLERPMEYITTEIAKDQQEVWTFEGL